MKVFANTKYLKNFTMELPLSGGHVVLSFVAAYMGYQTYSAYTDYTSSLELIENYRKELSKSPLQRHHQLAYQTPISVSGYPDDGTWLNFNLMSSEDWIRVNRRRVRYEELYNEFSTLVPMMALFGVQFPAIAVGLGLTHIYINNKLALPDAEIDKIKYRNMKKLVGSAIIAGSFISSVATLRKLLVV